MTNYFIRNRETDKLELHFDKATYKGMSSAQRDDIKKFFLFSRQAEAWVSKAKLAGGTTGAYYPIKIANQLGFKDEGETGVRKTMLQQVIDKHERNDRKKAFYTDVDEGIFIDWEKYTPSKRLNDIHNSISFYDHDYPNAFKSDLNETIADIKQRLRVGNEQMLPTYIKTAIERYAKGLSEYYAKYVNNRAYAPSPMVVGPAKYPWHRLDKVHHRDGRNFANLDEAKAKLKQAVERASPQAFEQRTDGVYLQNRIDEAQAQVKAMERGVKSGKHLDFYEPRLAQSNELLTYWQEQLGDKGGLAFSKQSLTQGGATHIMYGGKYYPIIRLSDKTVTIGKWFNDDPKITFQLPYAKISKSLVRWEDALLPEPGVKKPKIVKAFKKGDKAYFIRDSGTISQPRQEVYLVTVKSVGPKNYGITGSPYGSVTGHENLKPVGYGHAERLEKLLQGAKSYKKEITESIQFPDDTSKYDLKHLLNYGEHPYRSNTEILKYDLIAAGYPDKGGLLAFFKDKYGINGQKKGQAKPAKNAKYRTAATKKRAINAAKSAGKGIKARLEKVRERIAARRGVEPETVTVYLDRDINRVIERKLKTTVKETQTKRKAIKTGNVSTQKAKLTKTEKAEILAGGIKQAEAATGKKKELTAEQVIRLGRKIDFDRYHIVIDGQVYNIREDFDSKTTNKRRLAPTEANLIKWAKKPGRYDLIGVDNAGKVNVTVHRKKDKNKVPLSIRAKKEAPQLRKLQARITKKRTRK